MANNNNRCICTNLRRSSGAVIEYYDRWFSELGLTSAQYHLLLVLSQWGTINATDWAKCVGLERSTVVRNIQGLSRRGWIEEGGAGRGKQYRLSEAGNEILQKARKRWERAQDGMRDLLGDEDTDTLLRIADKLQAWKLTGDSLILEKKQEN